MSTVHKSRGHSNGDVSDLRLFPTVQTETDSQPMQSQVESNEGDPFQNSPELDAPGCFPPESVGESQAQLRKKNLGFFVLENAQSFVYQMLLFRT